LSFEKLLPKTTSRKLNRTGYWKIELYKSIVYSAADCRLRPRPKEELPEQSQEKKELQALEAKLQLAQSEIKQAQSEESEYSLSKYGI